MFRILRLVLCEISTPASILHRPPTGHDAYRQINVATLWSETMDQNQEIKPDLDQDESPEVTISHRPWFKRGDGLRWDELDAYDRTWPTVPRIGGMARFLHGSFDVTMLLHCMWVMALAVLLLA